MYDKDFYINNVKWLVVPGVWESIVTIPVVLLPGIFLFFKERGFCRQFKIIIIVLAILFGIPLAGSIMNGLSYSTDRWYFAILLFLILSALISMERVILLDKMQIVLFEIVSAGLILINIFLCGSDIGVFFRSIVSLGIALVLPIAWNHPKRDKYLFILFCMTIISNGIFVFGHALIGGSGYSWGFLPRKAALENMKESISNVELGKGDGFERLDIYDSSLATSLVMDYCGTTEYFSILNAYTNLFG